MATKDKKRRDDWICFTTLLSLGLFQSLLYLIRDSSELIIAVIPSLIAFLAAWHFFPRRKQTKDTKNDFNPSGFMPEGLKVLTNRLVQSCKTTS